MEINNLTPAELRVWRAFPRGEAVDFRTAEDEDVADGAEWGAERTVRAAVLRALLLNGPQEDGEIPALKLVGRPRSPVCSTCSTRTVDHAVPPEPLPLRRGPAAGTAPSSTRSTCSDSVLPGLDASHTRCEGVLRLTDCRVGGPVRLGGAQISGALFLDRAEITAADPAEPALQLNQVTIGDDLWARGCAPTARSGSTAPPSPARSTSTTPDSATPAHMSSTRRPSTWRPTLLGRRLRTFGWIGLRGARIAGRLDLLVRTPVQPGRRGAPGEQLHHRGALAARGPPDRGHAQPAPRPDRSLLPGTGGAAGPGPVQDLTYTFAHPARARRAPPADAGAGRRGLCPARLRAVDRRLPPHRRRPGRPAGPARQAAPPPRHPRPGTAGCGGTSRTPPSATASTRCGPAVWLVSLLAVGSVAYACTTRRRSRRTRPRTSTRCSTPSTCCCR